MFLESGYTNTAIENLASVLERAAPDAEIVGSELRARLLSLAVAVGKADDGDPFEAVFNSLAAADIPHAKLAECYDAIVASDDPFRELEVIETVRSRLKAFLRARSRRRRSRKPQQSGTSSDATPPGRRSEADKTALREHAAGLAAHHQSFVHPGAQRMSVKDTLLFGIADIYLEFTGLQIARHELPHSASSNFIRFAHLVIRPFFPSRGATKKALSSRWKRLKAQQLG